jgi:hypothetical protein
MFDTYPHDTIPILCHGGGYLLGKKLVEFLADNQRNLTFHRNEDVAVSLWLLDKECEELIYLNSSVAVDTAQLC